MPDSEQRHIIRDVLLTADVNARYDLYFTDNRVAIVFMGNLDRYSPSMPNIRQIPSTANAISPPLTYVDSRIKAIEEELSTMPLDQILKLSKKNSDYTYDEIERLQLEWGEELKFRILSEDYESELEPTKEQWMQLFNLLTTLEPTSDKLEVEGNWKELQKILCAVRCDECGAENDLDAVCCINCGQHLTEKPTTNSTGIACGTCGTMSVDNALFCKQCGAGIVKKE
ncbi:MAG: zinc ribbon domain-containing protein [Methanocella sp.]